MRTATLAVALLFPLIAAAGAQADPEPPSMSALRIEAGEVTVDGVLDEEAWARAAVAEGFVQGGPDPGQPATERTEARVTYDGSAIYVGMRMHDRGEITSALGRRDERVASDYASVIFDSYDDDRTAFQFETSPSGVQRDFLFYDDVREDRSWDAVWTVATSQDADGWTAEFRIPFSQLRYAAGDDQTWGLNFTREIHRLGERAAWAPLLPGEDGFVSRFGSLRGLQGLRAPRRLELLPYAASAVTRAPGDDANPFYNATDVAPRVGLDLKYGVTSDITLTATVNPDFGQVEADPAQVNLGGFELFFEERRPFFVEGTDVFSMEPRRFFSNNRPSLLYTRRIGRSPQRGSFVPEAAGDAAGEGGAVYADAPGQTTILGAAKATGRVGRFSFGVLDAVTAPEYGRYRAVDAGGVERLDGRALVEPASNFLVARTRGAFGRSRVGGLLTAVNRDASDPALAALLPGQAYVAGLDLEHDLADEWVLSAQVAGSLVQGSPEAIEGVQRAFPRLYQRPDNGAVELDPARTALAGSTGELNVIKTGGEHWLGSFHANWTSPGFDSNGLGFQGRADQIGGGGVVIYNQNEPQGAFRQWGGNVFAGLGFNYDGDRTNTFVGMNAYGNLQNFWGGNVNVSAGPRTVDDRFTRGGPIGIDPAGVNLNLNLSSDRRKPVSGRLGLNGGFDELGGRRTFGFIGVEARPSPNLTFRVGPEVGVSTTARQYVATLDAPAMAETFGQRYVFAEVDQTVVSLETRVDWTFTPDLSLQVYARPFVASGRYGRFQQLGAPGQLELPVFGEDLGSATTGPDGETTIDPGDGSDAFTLAPDFTVRSLQGNAVLRWQYRPGSTLFLVWQQQRSGFDPAGDFRFDNLGTLFTDDLTNVFLVKLSYWLG